MCQTYEATLCSLKNRCVRVTVFRWTCLGLWTPDRAVTMQQIVPFADQFVWYLFFATRCTLCMKYSWLGIEPGFGTPHAWPGKYLFVGRAVSLTKWLVFSNPEVVVQNSKPNYPRLPQCIPRGWQSILNIPNVSLPYRSFTCTDSKFVHMYWFFPPLSESFLLCCALDRSPFEADHSHLIFFTPFPTQTSLHSFLKLWLADGVGDKYEAWPSGALYIAKCQSSVFQFLASQSQNSCSKLP